MTTRKKKQKRTMVIALASVVVLGGAYIGITQFSKHQQKKEDEKAESESLAEAERLSVFSFPSSDIVKISYTNPDETLDFLYDSETKKWQYAEDADYPVSQIGISSIATTASQLNAACVVEENLDNLAKYGLDDPDYTITLTKADGSEITLYFGMYNSFTSQYYMYTDEKDSIYMAGTTLVDYASSTLRELLDVGTAYAVTNTDTVTYAEYAKGEESIWKLDYAADGSNSEYSYQTTTTWFYEKEDGTPAAADSDIVSTLLSNLGQISLSSCAVYQATEEQMEEYGLSDDAPVNGTLTATYTPDEEDSTSAAADGTIYPITVKLFIGKQVSDSGEATASDESEASVEATEISPDDLQIDVEEPVEETEADTRYYVRFAGSDLIYYLSADKLESIITLTRDDFVNRSYAVVALSSIEKMNLSFGEDGEIQYEIRREETENEDGETETVTTYYMNGEEIDASEMTEVYYDIISMSAARVMTERDEAVEYAPELEIVYHTGMEAYPTITIGFTPYNENYHQVTVMGETKLLINKRDVEAIVEMLEAL